MLGFVRTTFFILPVILFVWFMVYHDNFISTFEKLNSLQGRNGVLVINQHGKPTYGNAFGEWLESTFGKQSNSEWRGFYDRSGRDLDFVIRKIEDFWVWMLVAIFLLSGAFMLYAFRNYK